MSGASRRLNSNCSRYECDLSPKKIGLKLTSNNPESSKIKCQDRLIHELLKSDPDRTWIFLSTHGMWLEKVKDKEVGLLIDCLTGIRRLVINHENYELIFAILSIPMFDMHVEEVSYTKNTKEKVEKTEQQSTITSRGIHSKVRRGEILNTDIASGKPLEVTPLTFHAATCGYHRLGYSLRLAALQSALSREVACFFFEIKPPHKTYASMYGLSSESEAAGALASYTSALIRYYSEINLEAVDAEMTTSIIKVRGVCKENIVKSSRKLLYYMSENPHGIEARFDKDSRDLLLRLPDEEADRALQDIQKELKPFRRLVYVEKLKKKFEEWQKEDIENILLDFSEQMNTCDLYLLSLLVKTYFPESKLNSTWIICTPLTYPMASITSAYATWLSNLGKIRIVMSSEDVLVAKTLAESISEEIKKSKVLYLAAGPTSHVLSFGKTLKSRLGDNMICEALTP
ncbi:MAG: hypothetical protein QXF28_07330 [Nitrososphaerota archaeon]